MLEGKQQGIAAAKIALKILGGTPPSTLYPITAEKGKILFNRKQLEKWGLSEHPFIKGHADAIQ